MAEDKKPGFFDQIKRLVDGGSKPLPEAQTRGLKRPTPGQASPTDNLVRSAAQTSRLSGGAAPTGQLANAPTAPMGPGPSQSELSPKRLAMIDDFMNGRVQLERMQDPTYMYKIVSDERAYQTVVLKDLKERFALADAAEAQALDADIKRTSAIIQNLFKVLKYITGKQGRTGGTNFLS